MHMFVDLTLKISCNFTGLEVKVNYIKRAVWGVRKLLTTKVVSCEYKLRPWRTSCVVPLSFLRGKKITEMTKNQSKCVEAVTSPTWRSLRTAAYKLVWNILHWLPRPERLHSSSRTGDSSTGQTPWQEMRFRGRVKTKWSRLLNGVHTATGQQKQQTVPAEAISAGPLSPVCHWVIHLLHRRWFNWIISAKWSLNQCDGFKFFI